MRGCPDFLRGKGAAVPDRAQRWVALNLKGSDSGSRAWSSLGPQFKRGGRRSLRRNKAASVHLWRYESRVGVPRDLGSSTSTFAQPRRGKPSHQGGRGSTVLLPPNDRRFWFYMLNRPSPTGGSQALSVIRDRHGGARDQKQVFT